MPRNGSGTYTLPVGNPVAPDTVIQADWANDTMNDIATQLNGVLTRDGLLAPTAPFKAQDGTTSAPGVTFAAQTSSGMFRTPTAIGLSHGGIVQLELGTDGGQILGLGLAADKSGGTIGSLTIGGLAAPNVNTVLDVLSTTKAIRLPRLPTVTRLALANVEGLFTYDSDLDKLYYNNGTTWVEVAPPAATPIASQITSLAHGSIAATNVQSAINELADEKQSLTEKGVANGYASLGADGLILPAQLPPATVSDTFVVESEAEMLALPANIGDICVRNDLAISYILQAEPPSVLVNWVELQTAGSGVATVNGRKGDVVLAKGDVGLGSVDNTTDLSKPVSTATQSALNAKANLASPTFTGTVAGITKTMVGLSNVDNTTDMNKPVSTAQQSALDSKQNTSQKNIANGYVGLDATGKISPSYLPATTITTTYVVASESAMLALPANVGDMAVRSDINNTFILQVANPTILANWVELLSPSSAVTSVNGQVGAVVIENISGNAGTVTNGVYTTGPQTIDGIKTFNASPVAPTPTAGDNSTKLATTAFVKNTVEVSRTWKHSSVGAITREIATTYTNSTGHELVLSIMLSALTSQRDLTLAVDAVNLMRLQVPVSTTFPTAFFTAVVPPGSTYRLDGATAAQVQMYNWAELSS